MSTSPIWTGDNYDELAEWMHEHGVTSAWNGRDPLVVYTSAGKCPLDLGEAVTVDDGRVEVKSTI